MKILEIRALNGPNYWSVWRHKLIVMKLDLEEMEERPSSKIPGFVGRLEKLLPSMYEHRCSEGYRGGFFDRVEKGTWMGHIIEHVALEIQTLAGMEVGFGRTRSTGEYGIYNVVFAYTEERVGRFAAHASVNIVKALIEDELYELDADIQQMREIREQERLGPSTGSLVNEANSRGIPHIRLNKHSLVQLGYGINQRRIQATIASTTSSIAVELAGDKEETKYLLEKASIPVPKGEIVYDETELVEAIKNLGFPLVTKPINGNHGKGASINILNLEQAIEGLHAAKKYDKAVIVEKYITGHDHRLLVINYKFVAAAKRVPAMVKGDGYSTIQQLVDKVNADPRRGYGHEKVLTAIKIDSLTHAILKERNLSLESVIPLGEELYLKTTANISTGGTAIDVTDMVHPYNIFMAERIAKIIGLDICGIDLMTPDITMPVNENGAAVLEVNAAPGFRMHIAPTEGLPRNVAEPVVDMLFPPGCDSRIPIIAVTGTNGKTTTTRLIAHMVKTMGFKVGFTTTDGIYIQNRMVEKGDCTGARSAEFVLKDPTVNFAVLECARGGILKNGLGFHNCDIGIVTNIAEDHLGMKGINTLEDLARVKGVIAESVYNHGYAILNADDDLVYDMRKSLDCKIAMFSMDEHNPRILRHCENGGLAAVAENGYITICKGDWKLRVNKIINIPLTFSGKALFMIQNILPAVLAGYVRNFKIEDMRLALETFIPSPAQTPGRMNLFQFRHFQLMVDYAHNAAGMRAISKFLEKIDATHKVGIIAGVGDRRNEDIISVGEIAAQMFDEIIIRHDKNKRGRTEEELTELLMEGINKSEIKRKVVHVKNESQAVEHAIKNAVNGSFITVCSDIVPETLELVMAYKEKEDAFELNRSEIPNLLHQPEIPHVPTHPI
ncbi:MAG: cyanophycin synthetase [Bacteroidia bacterium]